MDIHIINAQADLSCAEESLKCFAETHGAEKENDDKTLDALFTRVKTAIGFAIGTGSTADAIEAENWSVHLRYYINTRYR